MTPAPPRRITRRVTTPSDAPSPAFADLAEGFDAPDIGTWARLAQKGLKDRPLDSLTHRVGDGIDIRPLYRAEDVASAAAVRAAPAADRARPWDVRAVVDHPEPAQANRLALEALSMGAHSLLLRLDPTGRDGVAVGGQDDLDRLLDGVLLDAATVALDAGVIGPQAANWLAVAAKGAPNAPLALDLDPISAFAISGQTPGAAPGHLNAAAQAAARHAGAYPKASLFLASGRFVHEAGGSDAQMLGAGLASAVAALRALGDAGLSPAEAASRIALGLSLDQRFFEGIAVMRAARLCWARLMAAAEIDPAPAARIDVLGSRRMLAARGVHTNLLRQTAAGFAAAAGGCASLALDPFTRPLGGAHALSRRQSLTQQFVLMDEAHLGRVADPAGGAWALESLTDQLARAAWAEFQRLEAEGGLIASLEAGVLQGRVEAARDSLLAEIRSGDRPLLGVTLHPQDEAATVVDPRPQYASAAPDIRQAGDDSRGRPLAPIRLDQEAEQ
ncbi:methylmalonyl-CoA mutase family protein [Brevundimonas sp.]|uniref:methylmalonyl-CoA mutase family protein n=1 Tax=Brevundimonas sp. TaxID=1871086 RepID=UPI0035B1B2DA